MRKPSTQGTRRAERWVVGWALVYLGLNLVAWGGTVPAAQPAPPRPKVSGAGAHRPTPAPIESGTMAFSEDFNRTDSASLGAPWSAEAGEFGIDTNQGYIATDVGTGYNLEVVDSTADGTVQATLATVSPGKWSGLVFRYSDAANYWLAVDYGFAVELIKVVAGAPTVVYGNSFSGGDGDVLKVVLSGDSITYYIGASIATGSPVTDSFNQTATKHGLAAEAGSTARWDDFSCPDAPAPPAPTCDGFGDDFTRADDSTLGDPWTDLAGEFGISGNEAVVTVDVGSGYNLTIVPSQANGTFHVQLPLIRSAAAGLAFRVQDENNFWMAVFGSGGSSIVRVARGNVLTVAHVAPVQPDGTLFSVVLDGFSMQVYAGSAAVPLDTLILHVRQAFNLNEAGAGLVSEAGFDGSWTHFCCPLLPEPLAAAWSGSGSFTAPLHGGTVRLGANWDVGGSGDFDLRGGVLHVTGGVFSGQGSMSAHLSGGTAQVAGVWAGSGSFGALLSKLFALANGGWSGNSAFTASRLVHRLAAAWSGEAGWQAAPTDGLAAAWAGGGGWSADLFGGRLPLGGDWSGAGDWPGSLLTGGTVELAGTWSATSAWSANLAGGTTELGAAWAGEGHWGPLPCPDPAFVREVGRAAVLNGLPAGVISAYEVPDPLLHVEITVTDGPVEAGNTLIVWGYTDEELAAAGGGILIADDRGHVWTRMDEAVKNTPEFSAPIQWTVFLFSTVVETPLQVGDQIRLQSPRPNTDADPFHDQPFAAVALEFSGVVQAAGAGHSYHEDQVRLPCPVDGPAVSVPSRPGVVLAGHFLWEIDGTVLDSGSVLTPWYDNDVWLYSRKPDVTPDDPAWQVLPPLEHPLVVPNIHGRLCLAYRIVTAGESPGPYSWSGNLNQLADYTDYFTRRLSQVVALWDCRSVSARVRWGTAGEWAAISNFWGRPQAHLALEGAPWTGNSWMRDRLQPAAVLVKDPPDALPPGGFDPEIYPDPDDDPWYS